MPCVCSSFFSLSEPIELKLVIAYRSFRCASGLYTILSHIDFNHFFLVVTIDCHQCLMILIVGMCMGFNMILNFFVTILCFALKHKSEACIVTILKACEKTLPIRFIAY